MTTPDHSPCATTIRPLPAVLGDVIGVLHTLAQRADSWLAQRKRAAQDLDALATMSDRELVDIGLNRASVTFVGNGGRIRDYPF